MGKYVDQMYSQLGDLATDFAEILVEYPNGLPDEICAPGECADADTVQTFIYELLTDGDIAAVETLLQEADDAREEQKAESATIGTESEGKQ